MPSQLLLDEHRAEVADIVAVAQADLAEAWPDLPLDDADGTRRLLAGMVTEMVADYGAMAAGAGADWYMESRAEAGVRGRLVPTLSVPLNAAQIDANVGWAVSPLYGSTDAATALSRAAGVVQRLTANADRATILTNARRDPAGVRWYRGASASCCSFCALVASRGAVYRSESSADFKAHNNCRCFPVVLFPGESVELPDYYQQFADEYATAAEAVAAEGGARSSRAVLKKMRELTGRA